MATTEQVITDDDLLRLPRDGCRYEVVDGALVLVSPAGWLHERIISKLTAVMVRHAQDHQLGDVLGSNALYVLPGGNKRGPHVSFVAAGRLASESGRPFPELAPDLAVEVLSPGDSARRILDKVGEYLQAGVRLVWVIDPERRLATSYRGVTDVRVIRESEALEGEEVLPGFRCALRIILD